MGWLARLTLPPAPRDPRYLVLERRDIREAVRIEVPLAIAIILIDILAMGVSQTPTHILAGVGLGILCLLLAARRSLVRRWPYATAQFVGFILLALLAIAIVNLPTDAPLVIGDYALIVVGSALLVTFNERLHRIWLAFSVLPMAVCLFVADLTITMRTQAILVGLGAIIASVIGNSLVQRRRERRFAREMLLRRQRHELRVAVARLESANATIEKLEGVLPICSHCKRIRDQGDNWVLIEAYVEKRSAAQFSHGICPDCLDRYYGEPVTQP